MRPVRVDGPTGALLRKVGAGRRVALDEGTLTMRFCRAGGDGLVLSARVDGAPMRVWVDTAQWCRWIEPVLSVPSWHAVPADLRDALAAWTCASAGNALERIGVSWLQAHSIEPGESEDSPAWALRVERADAALDLRVVDAPQGWLERLAEGLEPLPSGPPRDDEAPAVRLALAAGWSSIETSTLARVAAGDALLLHHGYAVAEGELALFADRPLACVVQCRTGPYTIGATMDTFDDWLDIDVSAARTDDVLQIHHNTLVRVVAQVATIDVPLTQLARLQPGDVLDGPAQPDGLVTLQVAGKPFARGTLLDIGGRLAVRIEYLLPA